MKTPSMRSIAVAMTILAANNIPYANSRLLQSLPPGAVTTLSDIIGPRGAYIPVIETFFTVNPTEKLAFMQSGVLGQVPQIDELMTASAVAASIPFWNPLDASVEPNYSNDVYEDIAVPRSVNTGLMTIRKAYLNEAFGAMSLVKAITQQDPLAYVARVLDNYWAQQVQKRVIATAIGLYNDNAAATDTYHTQNDMITDPDSAFTSDAWIDATAQMGDWLDAFGVVAMPRLVYTQMQKANQIDFVTDSDQKTQIPFYQGSRVVVDDGMPIIGTAPNRKALVIMYGPGAIGFAMTSPENAQEYDRAPERGNGGGVDTLWTRRDMVVHPLGYSFLSATITGNGTESRPASASWADLALATNWQRVLPRKQVPIAFLLVKV